MLEAIFNLWTARKAAPIAAALGAFLILGLIVAGLRATGDI